MTAPLDLAAASAEQLADRAWELLADGHTPQQVVARLTPATQPAAVHLARRLPLLDDRPTADRGAALARLAVRAGMRRFNLEFTQDGRLAASPPSFRPAAGAATRVFPGDGCAVTYTARYCPEGDHFSFVGTGEPPQPHPLSGSGHWSHFALPDAVAALGGPDRDRLFREAFEGAAPDVVRKPRKVVGKHTARAAVPSAGPASPTASESSGRENGLPKGPRSLFS